MSRSQLYISWSQYITLGLICPVVLFIRGYASYAVFFVALMSIVEFFLVKDLAYKAKIKNIRLFSQKDSVTFSCLCALLLLSSGVSTLFASYPLASLEIVLKVLIIGLGIFLFSLKVFFSEQKEFLKTITLSCAAALFIIFFEVYFGNTILSYAKTHFSKIFISNKYYSLSAVFALIFSWILLSLTTGKQRLTSALIALACIALCAFLNTYALFLAIPVGIIVALFVYLLPRKGPIILAFSILITSFSAPFLWTNIDIQQPSVTSSLIKSRVSFIHRFFIYKHTSELIFKSPLLGYGLGNYRKNHIDNGFNDEKAFDLIIKAKTSALTEDEEVYIASVLHIHNIFLQIWYELGLMGVILFIALSSFALYRISNIQGYRYLKATFCGCFSTLLALNFTDFNVWKTSWLAISIMALTLLYIKIPKNKNEKEEPKH